MSTIDWDQVIDDAEEAFQPLPTGQTDFQIVMASAGLTNDKQKDQITFTAKVITGPSVGRTTIANLTFSEDNPKAMHYLLKKLTVLGVSLAYLKEHRPLPAQIAEMIIGEAFTADVTHRIWQGQPRDNIDNYEEYTGTIPDLETPSEPEAVAPQGFTSTTGNEFFGDESSDSPF